jgi:hypothetical protein
VHGRKNGTAVRAVSVEEFVAVAIMRAFVA